MRFGTAWRIAVLASLALLMSSQLCMITTCLPRFQHQRSAAHACCRATSQSPMQAPAASGAMPCDMALDATSAPGLDTVSIMATPAVMIVPVEVTLVPPAHQPLRVAMADTGPPPGRLLPAPAGQRAPPQA